MATYQKNRHDFGVTNVGSDGTGTALTGFMMAKTPDGVAAWEEYDSRFLADQFFTGAPSQVNINPEEEWLGGQTDFRAGFGLEYYDDSDTSRYFSSIGMDLRFKGMAIAGPTPITVSTPTITPVSASNLDFESWASSSDANNWSEPAGNITRNSDDQRSGTYCAEFSHDTTGESNVTVLSQSIAWDNEYRSRVAHWDCYLETSRGASWYISIYDGVGRTSSAQHTGGGSYELLSVSRVLDSSATECSIEVRTDGEAGGVESCRIDDGVFSLPVDGKTVAFVDFNDERYMARGNVLCKLNGAGSAYDYVFNFITTITDLEVFTDNKLYIALGNSNAYWEMTTTEAFTKNTLSNNKMELMVTVHTTAPTMYANDSGNTIRSTTNPADGGSSWSTTTTVGSASDTITRLMERNGALLIGKEDTVYYLDSSGNVQRDLAPELKTEMSTTSGKNAHEWDKKIYYPAGDQALLEIGSSANTWRNPSSYCTNLADFVGRIFAVSSDAYWLFAAVDNDTKVEILAGRNETVGTSTSWVWHPFAEITLAGVETMSVTNVVSKRLEIASTNSSDSLYYIPLYTKYGDPTNDSNRKFKTGVTFETPWLHGNFLDTNKAWISLSLTMGHTYNASRYFTVKYKKFGDSSWTSIGNFAGTSSSMVDTKFIDTSNKPFSPMMKFQFTAVTNDTDETPILHSYKVKAVMYPDIRRLIHAVVIRANNVQTKTVVDVNAEAAIKTTLDNARDNAVWFVSIRDPFGNTRNVKFLPTPGNIARLLPTRKEKGREFELHYHILMLEVSLS